MSDTFDHEGDAWDSYEQMREDDESYFGMHYIGGNRSSGAHAHSPTRSAPDPLYYHQLLRFRKMTATTDKAVELELMDGRLIWVPRSVCRNWCEGQVHVHGKTLRVSLSKARDPNGYADLLDEIPDDDLTTSASEHGRPDAP